MAVDAPGLAPRQLGDVRVLLLRHDGRAGGEGVVQLDEAELGAWSRDTSPPPGARGASCRTGALTEVFEDEVAVGDGIQAVGAHPA